jgi:hypothetical protein
MFPLNTRLWRPATPVDVPDENGDYYRYEDEIVDDKLKKAEEVILFDIVLLNNLFLGTYYKKC